MSFEPIKTADQLVENDDLIGSLRVANPFDLSQFLLLNNKSGTLTIFRRGGTTKIFFDEGQIVNGLEEPGNKQGKKVALHALTIKEGGFRFREEQCEAAHLIDDTTQNLLLEAARSMDEAAAAAGEESPGMQEQLRAKQEQTEALEKVFAMLEQEVSEEGETPPLDTLLTRFAETKGARLYLEPGRHPLVLQGGRVTHVLEGTVSSDVARDAVKRAGECSVLLYNGVRYRVRHDWHGERLMLRPIRKPIALEKMNLVPEAVEGLLATRGKLLFLVGDTPEVAAQLHAAVLAALAERGDAVIQLGEWDAKSEQGLIVPVPYPASEDARQSTRAMLSALRPSYLAFPEIRTADDAALALGCSLAGHGAIVTMTGRDGGDAIDRALEWFRADGGDSRRLAKSLAGVIAVRVGTDRTGNPFAVTSVARVTEDCVRAILREDFAALTGMLERNAGDQSFLESLARLVSQKKMGEDDAGKLAPNLPQALSIDPG